MIEEGTFTPEVIGSIVAGEAAYINQAGNYARIGNVVYIQCVLGWSNHTGTGSLVVTGLPFNAIATGGVVPLNLTVDGLAFTSQLVCRITNGTPTIEFRDIRNNANALIINVDESVSYLGISGVYLIGG